MRKSPKILYSNEDDDEIFDYRNESEEDKYLRDNNALDFLEWIQKDVTAVHQVTLLFLDYDVKKPRATETTCVLVNLFNFVAAFAGDNVKIRMCVSRKTLWK